MLKAIIIDDEQNAIDLLLDEIEKNCPEIKVIDTCCSGMEGAKSIRKHQPDVVFLDIDMPGLNGFQVMEVVEDMDFEVIFITAYNQYVLEALRLSAIDYLLKPIGEEELITAVQRLLRHKRAARYFKRHYKALTYNLNEDNVLKKVAFPTQEGYEFIASKDILYCKADSNYTTVHLNNDTRRVYSRSLKATEEILESYYFYRIHNSHLINLNHIRKYIRGDGGWVVMTNNEKLSVSRQYKRGLLKLIS